MERSLDLYNKWINDPYNAIAFMDYVRYLCKIESLNEVRLYELYRSMIDFSIKDWPNIAVCALKSTDDFSRKVAIELMGYIDPLISLSTLAYIYNNANTEEERGICLVSLGRSQDSSIVPFIIYAYQSEMSWALRDDACYALGIVNSERAIPFLYEVVLDEKERLEVRKQALKSIIHIEGFIATRRLKKILLNRNIDLSLREMTAEGLYKKDEKILVEAFDIISLEGNDGEIKDIIANLISTGELLSGI